MRHAIQDLNQLSDVEFFATVSEGLGHIHEHATSISKQSAVLAAAQANVTGVYILRMIAEEEAGKFLILMDAVRCPRNRLSQHLPKFWHHLAKGIYSESVNWSAGSLRQLREIIEEHSKAFYLDGPNDVDWIFRNAILQQRDEAFYVDYVDTGDNHVWLSPVRYQEAPGASWGLDMQSASLDLIEAMTAAGMTTPRALAMIAARWRPIPITDDFGFRQNHETIAAVLDEMRSAGELRDQSDETRRRIIEWWRFPMHSIDLGIVEVDQKELREIQKRFFSAPFNPDL